ncbi:hypothetical protein [Neoroseomonas lacus]|uniref:Uncharacterized protein n=1 Tax=Neoroseomonas lacus TaxID=287609 RepID=A0A917KW02_9PROT|nr:hypothetical protein [Neoroseomonas lacus]GGJ32642.1 hypothetical protein GCM10011320_45330 [Neoroseomonas lacus]
MGHILPFPRLAPPWPSWVEGLDPAATLVLTACIRPWVAAARRKDDPLPLVMAALEEAPAPKAAGLSAHALMHGIALQASRMVEIGCPTCPAITPDEMLLLHAVAEASLGADHPALILGGMVHGSALVFLDPPLIGLARRLDAEGWHFRPRRVPVAVPADAVPWRH